MQSATEKCKDALSVSSIDFKAGLAGKRWELFFAELSVCCLKEVSRTESINVPGYDAVVHAPR